MLRTIAVYLLLLLSLLNVVPVMAQSVVIPIKVTLDNGIHTEEGKLYELDKIKYLSAKGLADFLDADIKWLPVSKKVIISLKGVRIEFVFNKHSVTINGRKLKMVSECRLEKGSALIPLDFIKTARKPQAFKPGDEWPPVTEPVLTGVVKANQA